MSDYCNIFQICLYIGQAARSGLEDGAVTVQLHHKPLGVHVLASTFLPYSQVTIEVASEAEKERNGEYFVPVFQVGDGCILFWPLELGKLWVDFVVKVSDLTVFLILHLFYGHGD
jgi:hypothetical protein